MHISIALLYTINSPKENVLKEKEIPLIRAAIKK